MRAGPPPYEPEAGRRAARRSSPSPQPAGEPDPALGLGLAGVPPTVATPASVPAPGRQARAAQRAGFDAARAERQRAAVAEAAARDDAPACRVSRAAPRATSIALPRFAMVAEAPRSGTPCTRASLKRASAICRWVLPSASAATGALDAAVRGRAPSSGASRSKLLRTRPRSANSPFAYAPFAFTSGRRSAHEDIAHGAEVAGRPPLNHVLASPIPQPAAPARRRRTLPEAPTELRSRGTPRRPGRRHRACPRPAAARKPAGPAARARAGSSESPAPRRYRR